MYIQKTFKVDLLKDSLPIPVMLPLNIFIISFLILFNTSTAHSEKEPKMTWS